MRRTVLIVPGLLSGPDAESYLRQSLPALNALCEMSVLRKVSAAPPSETPEAMLLGMSPSIVSLRQGPLTVSALGFDPPDRSTHFHLSLMSFLDGIASMPSMLPRPEDLEILMTAAKRLNTKLLTVLQGETFDHALVWEALGDLGTKSAVDVNGKTMAGNLPEGDGEPALRRFIDDSINLLTSLELNERRLDEGLPPFNLLWPWGHGVRTPVPNLALERGQPAVVESASMRLAGLTRLAGYRHYDRREFGSGLRTRLRNIAGRCMSREVNVVYINVAEELRTDNKQEELEWFVREFDRELLQPLLEDHLRTPSRLALVAPGPLEPIESKESAPSLIGLSVVAEPAMFLANIYPFDERSLDEKTIPKSDLWTIVEAGLAG